MNLDPGLFLRKIAYRASRALVPEDTVKVVQARLSDFDLLVLANEDVGRQIAYLRRYESVDSAFLAHLVRPDDICFDIGANTGYYTMLFARRAGRGAVHAFEPIAFNWHLLKCSVMLNRLDNVVANNCALGATHGLADFSQSSDGAYSSLIAVGRKPEVCRTTVTIDMLSRYVERHAIDRIDVIKVDVEGAEGLVLEGARDLLRDERRRPRVALLELYDENLRPYGTSVDALVRTMADFGYLAYCVSRGGEPVRFGPQHHNLKYNVFFACDPKSITGQLPVINGRRRS